MSDPLARKIGQVAEVILLPDQMFVQRMFYYAMLRYCIVLQGIALDYVADMLSFQPLFRLLVLNILLSPVSIEECQHVHL